MKTLILTAAAVVLSFSMVNSAEASDKAPSGKSSVSGFQTRGGFHGHFRGHHAYSHNYRGWSQRRWFGNHGCYGHYCPQRACWYYMYQPGNCYLPISVAQTYAPVSVFPNAPPIANLPPNLPPVTPNLPPIQPVKPIKPVKPV